MKQSWYRAKNGDSAKQKALLKQKALKKLQQRKPLKAATAGSRPSRWRHPAIWLGVSLFAVILIVPALVVGPFSKGDTALSNTEKEREIAKAEHREIPQSAFSVAVMRTASEQIENVPLETYVARVVASEMPADFELEALKAQSLAARTYIVNHLLSQKGKDSANVTDTVQHQVYKNEDELRKAWGSSFEEKMKKLKTAVQATEGEILTYHRKPITPSFFSTSNGYTENSEDYWGQKLPYLRSVKSPWDLDSPKFKDQEVFTKNQVAQALGVNLAGGNAAAFEVTRTDSGRVAQLKLGERTFSGKQVRELLRLPSSDFRIEEKNGHFIFTTKGFGHGVGMSQYGANGMAREGKTYKDIVSYYYHDVEIRPVQEAAPALVSK